MCGEEYRLGFLEILELCQWVGVLFDGSEADCFHLAWFDDGQHGVLWVVGNHLSTRL